MKKKLPAEGAAAFLPSLSKLLNCSSLIMGNSLSISKDRVSEENVHKALEFNFKPKMRKEKFTYSSINSR